MLVPRNIQAGSNPGNSGGGVDLFQKVRMPPRGPQWVLGNALVGEGPECYLVILGVNLTI